MEIKTFKSLFAYFPTDEFGAFRSTRYGCHCAAKSLSGIDLPFLKFGNATMWTGIRLFAGDRSKQVVAIQERRDIELLRRIEPWKDDSSQPLLRKMPAPHYTSDDIGQIASPSLQLRVFLNTFGVSMTIPFRRRLSPLRKGNARHY
jgi:hypothetical protein